MVAPVVPLQLVSSSWTCICRSVHTIRSTRNADNGFVINSFGHMKITPRVYFYQEVMGIRSSNTAFRPLSDVRTTVT